jgi:hypothetical protein
MPHTRPHVTPLQYDADGLPIVINTATDYTRTLIARASAMRERNPNWYDMTQEQQQTELAQLTQQETPMPTPHPTTKHETFIITHVRFDMNTSDAWCAQNATERIASVINHAIAEAPSMNVDLTGENISISDMKQTWVNTVQSKTVLASENRRRPNLWLTGQIQSVMDTINNWNDNWRSIRKTDKLAGTCTHLNTVSSEMSYIQLPTLPIQLMTQIVDEARRNHDVMHTDRWVTSVREAVITRLDGLFEDCVPVDSQSATNVEPF